MENKSELVNVGIENFGRWLANERKKKKISQIDLAYQVGIHPVQLCNIENGKTLSTFFTLKAIANALGWEVTMGAKRLSDDSVDGNIDG